MLCAALGVGVGVELGLGLGLLARDHAVRRSWLGVGLGSGLGLGSGPLNYRRPNVDATPNCACSNASDVVVVSYNPQHSRTLAAWNAMLDVLVR